MTGALLGGRLRAGQGRRRSARCGRRASSGQLAERVHRQPVRPDRRPARARRVAGRRWRPRHQPLGLTRSAAQRGCRAAPGRLDRQDDADPGAARARFSAIAVPPWARASSRTIDRPSRCPARSAPGRRGRSARRRGSCRPAGSPGRRRRPRTRPPGPSTPADASTASRLEPDVAARFDAPPARCRRGCRGSGRGRAGRPRATDRRSPRPAGAPPARRRRRARHAAPRRPPRTGRPWPRGPRRRRSARAGARRVPGSQPVDRAELADEPLEPAGLLGDRRGRPLRGRAGRRPVGEGRRVARRSPSAASAGRGAGRPAARSRGRGSAPARRPAR